MRVIVNQFWKKPTTVRFLRLIGLSSISVASGFLLVGYYTRNLRKTQVRALMSTSVVLMGPIPHMIYTNLGGIIQP